MKNEILKKRYNYDNFRYGQENIIQNVVDGKNTLAIMPTGGGKSLVFQISGEILKRNNCNKGITLIISPLISLMQDQTKEFSIFGYVGYSINSTLKVNEKQEIIQKLISNEVDFLVVSPETLFKLKHLLLKIDLNLVVVDEVHSISEWGHNFRPYFLEIGNFLKEISYDKQILGLTATANDRVINDIKKYLYLGNNFDLFVSGIYRKNLRLKKFEEKDNTFVLNKMKEIEFHKKNGVIYFNNIKEIDYFSNFLNQKGITHGIYHGKIDMDEKRELQNNFLNGKINLLLATNAFGMGINKKDIDYIFHYGYSQTIEGYSQEIGRSGRDGRLTHNYIFCGSIEKNLHIFDLSYLNSDQVIKILKSLENYSEEYDYINGNKNEKITKLKISMDELSIKIFGNEYFSNSIFSFLYKNNIIEKNHVIGLDYGVYFYNSKVIDFLKTYDFKKIDELKKIKRNFLLKQIDIFSYDSDLSTKNLDKYLQGNKQYLPLIIYVNILDYFNDVDGINELLKDNKDIFLNNFYHEIYENNIEDEDLNDKINEIIIKKNNTLTQKINNQYNIFD